MLRRKPRRLLLASLLSFFCELVVSQKPRVRGDDAALFQMHTLAKGSSSSHIQSRSNLIPSVVFFTGPWKPQDVVDNNKHFVPKGTEFRHYSNAQVDASVYRISKRLAQEADLQGAWDAYSSLRPWAFRADLWRLMALWENGGIYMDAKYVLAQPMSTWIDQANDSFVTCWDDWENHYFNAVMASRPKHPSMLAVLRHVVSNVKQRYYGDEFNEDHMDLDITGPGALTAALELVPEEEKPRADCKLMVGDGIVRGFEVDARIVQLQSGMTIMGSVRHVHQSMRNCSTCRSYTELWLQHAVYCDEEYPDNSGSTPCGPQIGLPDVPVRAATRKRFLTSKDDYWSQVV